MPIPDEGRAKVFIGYSHQDDVWLERLQVHLTPLERDGLIDRWDHTRIRAGSRWRDEIKSALDAAQVAVLLISADFMASDLSRQVNSLHYWLPQRRTDSSSCRSSSAPRSSR